MRVQVLVGYGRFHAQTATDRPPHGGRQRAIQGIEKGQDRIPQKVHDDAAMLLQHFDHLRKMAIHQFDGGFRTQGLRQGRKTPDIREQDHHFPLFTPQSARFRVAQQFPGDFLIHVASEGIADKVAFLQTLHHVIKARGQLADFVPAVHRDGFAVAAFGHQRGASGYPLNRSDQRG